MLATSTTVECLRCGTHRQRDEYTATAADECVRCGYVGWAPVEDLDDEVRERLLATPVERRAALRHAS